MRLQPTDVSLPGYRGTSERPDEVNLNIGNLFHYIHLPEMVVSVDDAVKTILAVPRPTHRVVRVVFLEPDHDQDDDNEND